jgi:protoporphyrinogen oxidase
MKTALYNSPYKFLILGAGPAGLAFAARLKQRGETSFLILEKEDKAGGLCRSTEVDGAPLDTGGGHFLDTRSREVTDFLFQFMPRDEWNLFERDSRIFINNNFINSPIEANIWQMDIPSQVAYLKSIAVAGCNLSRKTPEKFIDWIYWKLGEKIAADYMIPYNTKMFGKHLNSLGTYWLEKLPNVSFEETLLSCLERKPYGTQPGHARFLYLKYHGYGEVWLRMAASLRGHIRYHAAAWELDVEKRAVNNEFQAERIITTVPWTSFTALPGMPAVLREKIRCLKHTAVEIVYQDGNMDTAAHWIYYPQMEFAHHRVLVRHNFCPDSRGVWTETNAERAPAEGRKNFAYLNEYAYPLNTIEKPAIMAELLAWARERGVFGLGRWGEHQHYNSDVTVERALALAKELC